MTKRILSMVLALSMALSICPVSAFADTGGGMFSDPAALQTVDEQNDLPSTSRSLCQHSVSNVEEFNAAVSEISSDNTSYYLHQITLNNDIDVTDAVTFGAGHHVQITGGHTIKFSGNNALKVSGATLVLSNICLDGQSQCGTGISVENGGALIINENSCIQNFTNHGVYVGSGSSMTMNGGSITNCSAGSGGGVYIDGGSLTMNGGSIENCKATGRYGSGGGIYFTGNGSLTMGDGKIKDCTASSWGGGVYANGTFELTGGSITNCSALSGGGVCIDNTTTTLNGGTISGCKATRGGGVYIASNDSILEMNKGSITGCEVTGDIPKAAGGGVYINGSGRMNMTGGSITGCGVTDGTLGSGIDIKGGGVYVYSGSMNMTGGSITKCSASSGGGIYINSDSIFTDGGSMTMNGGSITDCTASNWGGGIYNDQLLTLTSGTVCNNTAATQGADIYLGSSMTTNTTLLDAAAMGQTYGTTGSKIDGWYKDASGARYTPGPNGTPVDVVNALTQDMALVASYRTPSAITVNGGTASVGGTTVTEAKKGEVVTLTYTGAFDFVNWQVNGTDIDGNTFAMPGHAVKVTPVVKAADIIPQYTLTVDPPEGIAADAVTVTVGGSTVKSAAEGAAVSIAFNASALPADGSKAFGEWVVTDADGKAVTVTDGTFTMPAGNVTISFTLVDVAKPDPEPEPTPEPEPAPADDTGAGAAIVLGTVAAGGAAYLVGTQIWLESHLPQGAAIPVSRQQLADLLWNSAGKPQPAGSALYADVSAAAADSQAAARWCVEQGLLADYGESFKPGNYTFRFQVIKAWNELQAKL